MELARAFTKRVKRSDLTTSRVVSIRDQISGPVALISSTNMLSYNAPDIVNSQRTVSDVSGSTAPSTPTRLSFDVDSDASSPSQSSTQPSSVDSSPSSETGSPHSYFFKMGEIDDNADVLEVDAVPILPERALSHSKREHQRLSRQRSMRFSRSSSQSMHDSCTARNSLDPTFNGAQPASSETLSSNPFSRELEQLTEVAEEFGSVVMDVATEEDLTLMHSRGLVKFDAFEYLREIQPLWDFAFADMDRNGTQL